MSTVADQHRDLPAYGRAGMPPRSARLLKDGRAGERDGSASVRFVTHIDVSREQCEAAANDSGQRGACDLVASRGPGVDLPSLVREGRREPWSRARSDRLAADQIERAAVLADDAWETQRPRPVPRSPLVVKKGWKR